MKLRHAWFVLLLVAGCAKSAPVTSPQLGRITVGVTTRDANRHEDMMTFAVDIQPGGTFESISADAGVYDEDVPAGDYVVRLTRLPAKCHVNGVSDRRVTVSPRRTTAVRFTVTCD